MKMKERMKGAWLVYDGYPFWNFLCREILTFVGVCGVVIRGGWVHTHICIWHKRDGDGKRLNKQTVGDFFICAFFGSYRLTHHGELLDLVRGRR